MQNGSSDDPDRGWRAELMTLPFYHPNIADMSQLLQLLTKFCSTDGNFLLRNSFSSKNAFTVSAIQAGGVKHFAVRRDAAHCYFYNCQFRSVSDLIAYYRLHDVPNTEGIAGLRLIFPIPDYTRLNPALARLSSNREWVAPRLRHSAPCAALCVAPPLGPKTRRSEGSRIASFDDPDQGPSSFPPPPPVRRAAVDVPPIAPQPRPTSTPAVDVETCQHRVTGCVRRVGCVRGAGGDRLYYSSVRDVYQDKAQLLINGLRLDDDFNSDRCSCGLYVDDAELPRGWTVHLCGASGAGGGEGTRGETKVFYQSQDEVTRWQLPAEVLSELSAEQHEFIRKLEGGLEVGVGTAC